MITAHSCRRWGHKMEYWLMIGKDRCARCGITEDQDEIRRKPLTEQQKRLLTFYRDERKWHRDIQDRAIAPDKSVVRRSEATKLFK